MLKAEQIPDEVIDAAVAMRDRGGSMSDIIRTALNAWPGMRVSMLFPPDVLHVVLPLTKEASDD